jgi:hypothetical protein
MNGSVSLLIALVSYGNSYLTSGTFTHILDFNNSTLVYNNTLSFTDGTYPLKTDVIANDPQEWFAYLKKDGCKKLKIYYKHSKDQSRSMDFETAGFVGGGGDWIIEAVYNSYSNYWRFKQDVTKPKAANNRIWGTQFFVIKHKPSTKKIPSINISKSNLAVSLKHIMNFAFKVNRKNWAEQFEKAIKNLDDPNPTVDFYKDFIPPNTLSLQAKQLLFSASISDVFGGMGSWNDALYDTNEDNDLNNTLSADLFDKINEAITAALNN